MKSKVIVAFLFSILALAFAAAQQPVPASDTFADDVGNRYWFQPDVVYSVENGHENKLDVIYPHNATEPVPAVIYVHGGGWIFGDKGGAVFHVLPYLKMGWAAVNVEYRMASTSKAPGAVEDCRCALRWIWRNAGQYHIDPTRLVVTGHSAGGHLSLMTGMLKESDGLDNDCPDDQTELHAASSAQPHVAAIVNWYGITDVADLIEGPNRKNYAVMWLGTQLDRQQIARRASPLSYVRSDNPPIITIHGDADDVVPYSQAVRLQQALSKAGVNNELFTVKGGGHGQFTDAQNRSAYDAVRSFLARHGLRDVK